MNKIDTIINLIHLKEDEYPDIKDPKEQALFYRMERLAAKYAKRFFDCLCADELTNSTILPIVFYEKDFNTFLKMKYGMGRGDQVTVSRLYPKQIAIHLTLPRRTRSAFLGNSLKRSIRHEVLHYYLLINDLPWEDDSALFWAMATIFDAKPYKKMNQGEQEKYDRFKKSYEEYPFARFHTLKHLAYGIVLGDEKEMESFYYYLKSDLCIDQNQQLSEPHLTEEV